MAKFRGTGKKYNKEILQGAASAAVGGALVGATFGHRNSPHTRAYNSGQGAGSATSAYLLGYGIRKGYKGYKAKQSTKLLNTGGVKRYGKKV